MAEYLIRGETLTAIADAIREKTGSTNKMKPMDFPSAIASIEAGGTSKTVLIPTQTKDNFAPNSSYGGLYMAGFNFPESGYTSDIDSFTLNVGEKYVVVWDGTEYECVAMDVSALMTNSVGLGNGAPFGLSGNNEPFALIVTHGMGLSFFSLTDALSSHEVGLYQVTTGGSADVRYVTFMNGSTELYKKAVLPGDDCMDVVVKGWISKPTKESPTQVFTYSGWSLTDGGSASATALQNVTEDRTVYAVYTATTRYYTVRFFDGDTLLNTMQVTYGSTADYTATKAGWMFNGWKPSNANIVENTDCYAQWREGYSPYSWEGVAANVADGSYKSIYKIGDTIPLDLGSEGTVNMQIAGFDCDTLADGSGTAAITWISVETLKTKKRMHSGGNLLGGWVNSELRAYLKGTIKPMLPDVLKSAIKEVAKPYNNFTSYSEYTVDTASDDLWVPSQDEVAGASSLYYALFQNTNSLRVKYTVGTTERAYWWLRFASTASMGRRVGTYGAPDSGTHDSEYGVVVCFCI